MADFLKRHSISLISIVLIVVSFQLMSASVRDRTIPQIGGQLVSSLLSPFQRAHHNSFEAVRYYWHHYLWLLDVQAERDELVERIKALEAKNSRLVEYETENKRLRSLLEFPERSNLRRVAASVIGRDPTNWVRSVTIDRGREDGLKEGLAVVDGHAVIGQTIAVSRFTARVLLLTDRSSAIAAIEQSSRAPGVVEGTSGDSLRLRYLEKGFELSPGQRVIASGVDGIYPKGVALGVITRVGEDKGGLFQDVDLAPSADLKRLESVLVLVPRGAGASDDDTENQER
jgi:rod shape-determining protein MreC